VPLSLSETLTEHGDNIGLEVKSELEAALEDAKNISDYESVKAASVRLSDALQAVGAQMYQAAQENEQTDNDDGDVIDAEFEEN